MLIRDTWEFPAYSRVLQRHRKYLWTIIVIADVYWCFAQSAVCKHTTVEVNIPALVRPQPLYILLRVEQGPMFLINSRQRNFYCVLSKRGGPYPEVTVTFLPSSLTKFHSFTLALLRLSTCVGYRYGLNILSSPELFWEICSARFTILR